MTKSKDLDDIISLFSALEAEVDSMSDSMLSLKRDDQFLQSAVSTWVEDIRSLTKDVDKHDKADTS